MIDNQTLDQKIDIPTDFLRIHSRTFSKVRRNSFLRVFSMKTNTPFLITQHGGMAEKFPPLPPFRHMFSYIPACSIFLKKVFVCRKFCSKQCHFNFHSRHEASNDADGVTHGVWSLPFTADFLRTLSMIYSPNSCRVTLPSVSCNFLSR